MEADQPQLPEQAMGDATERRPASRASSISSRSIHSTRSLLSTDLTHVVENGRIYPNDSYYMPCDGLEQTRLEILHRLFLTALDGALTTAKLPPQLQRVLDVGTGPGEWASQMAEHFPDAEIVAVDLAVWELPAREAPADSDEEDGDDNSSSCGELDSKSNVVWEIDDLEPYAASSRPSSSPPELRAQLVHVTADIEGLAIDQGYASGSTTAEGGGPGDNKTPPLSTSALSSEMSRSSPSSPPSSHPEEQLQQQQHAPLLGDGLAVDDGWNFSEPFDFVHVRDLKGAFRDWRAVYREAYASLAPGGQLEVVEIMPDLSTFASPPASLTSTIKATSRPSGIERISAVRELANATVAAAEASGRPLSLDHLDEKLFVDAGFCDVERRCVDVPMGSWPDDACRARMGKMWLVCCAEGLEASSLRLLTRHAGWDAAKVREKVAAARTEILEGRCGAVETKMWFVTARKGKGGRKRGT